MTSSVESTAVALAPHLPRLRTMIQGIGEEVGAGATFKFQWPAGDAEESHRP